MTETESLRARFIGELVESGTVKDLEWLMAFRDIPREVFVPYYFTQAPELPGWRLVEQPDPAWLDGIYSMRALVTQIDGSDGNASLARNGRIDGLATSSSSAPTLMAVMLEALDTHWGHRVLEVGTGTGYHTALLCHRLGMANVASVDIDAGLVDLARERLATVGYLPYLTVMDVRANQHRALDILPAIQDSNRNERETALPVDGVTDTSSPFEFFVALMVGGYAWLRFAPSDGRPAETWLTQPDGSWACHTTDPQGRRTVRQDGPTRLWDRIEAAHRQWQQLGQPTRQRFGLTVSKGQHTLWLDRPGSPQRWDLHALWSHDESPSAVQPW